MDTHPPARPARRSARQGRPFLGVLFECCGVYARIYRDPDARFYVGRCPRCLRVLKVRVGPDGTPARFLRAR